MERSVPVVCGGDICILGQLFDTSDDPALSNCVSREDRTARRNRKRRQEIKDGEITHSKARFGLWPGRASLPPQPWTISLEPIGQLFP